MSIKKINKNRQINDKDTQVWEITKSKLLFPSWPKFSLIRRYKVASTLGVNNQQLTINNLLSFITCQKSLITKSLFAIAVVGLILEGCLYLYSIPSVRQTIVLATTVQPERFTELYFENHLDLPKDTVPGKMYSFKFTVHNLEYQDFTYNYESYLDLGDKKVEIDHGSFTLKQDQYKTVQQTYSLIRKLPKTSIVVNLINKNNQQIDYWVNNN